MDAFDIVVAVGATCGPVLGILLAGSWSGVYLGFRLGLWLGGFLFLLTCVGVVALPERRKRRGGQRQRR